MYNAQAMGKLILVLFSYRSHKKGYIEKLFGRLQKRATSTDLRLSRGSLSDLHISVLDNKLSIFNPFDGLKLEEYNAVYFELWYKAQQQALAAATYLSRMKVPFFSKELTGIMPTTKIGELATLADNNIPLPDTFTSSNAEIEKAFWHNPPLQFPVVLKAADGYGGNHNFLIKSYNHLVDTLKQYKNLTFIVQEFIANDCDYRCLVFGDEIKLVLKRTRKGDTHLNNTSKGATGKMIDPKQLSPQARTDVLKAAKILRRDQFAGVDLIIDSETGQHYILEVNQTPQIEIGAEIDKKMDALLEYISRLSDGGNHA